MPLTFHGRSCRKRIPSLSYKSIFHRFNFRLDDALDSSHAHTQAPHHKTSAASHRHLRSLQFSVQVQQTITG